jgi:hypothetical protein
LVIGDPSPNQAVRDHSLSLAEHANLSARKQLGQRNLKSKKQDFERPENIIWLGLELKRHRPNIPMKFENRPHGGPITPKLTNRVDKSEGMDLNRDMPWCRFLKWKRGKPDDHYNERHAQAVFFELAPHIFKFLERKFSFVTSVMMAEYTCFPFMSIA